MAMSSRFLVIIRMDRGEYTGLIGVGFLFGLIPLFLLVVCLNETGHAKTGG